MPQQLTKTNKPQFLLLYPHTYGCYQVYTWIILEFSKLHKHFYKSLARTLKKEVCESLWILLITDFLNVSQ